jgi:class 3 adenylate cyclase/pimeloyl-ACP methyl ester carboxylesterase
VEPQIRYTRTSDDVSIAYWSYGSGQTIVQAPLIPFSHIEREWHNPHVREWYQGLGRSANVVRYDGRGNGLSARGVSDVSLEAHVGDLEAVVDQLGSDPVAVMGVFHSGPAAILYAARHPERVSHLILWCTYARGEDYWRAAQAEGLRALRQTDYALFLRTAAHELFGWAKNHESDQFAELMRAAASPEDADRLIVPTRSFDVTEVLAEVQCPALVVHRRELQWLDLELSRGLAARIPGARLVVIDGQSPLPSAGEIEPALGAVFDFLGVTSPEPIGQGSSGAFRAVLFTDLVDHTKMISALGDEKGREVLRQHEQLTREVLQAHGGTEVKTLGDGFMASFKSVTEGVKCAIALQRRLQEWNAESSPDMPDLAVRIGLNAGEPIEEDGDLFGAAVILASRIAASAEGAQILASNAVRELAAGKGFTFTDHGSLDAKGFDEPVRVWLIDWSN